MLAAEDLTDMAAFAMSQQGFFILDEIYQGLHHGEPEWIRSYVTQNIYVSSFSKFFGMAGWRLGWIVCQTKLLIRLRPGPELIHIAKRSSSVCYWRLLMMTPCLFTNSVNRPLSAGRQC